MAAAVPLVPWTVSAERPVALCLAGVHVHFTSEQSDSAPCSSEGSLAQYVAGSWVATYPSNTAVLLDEYPIVSHDRCLVCSAWLNTPQFRRLIKSCHLLQATDGIAGAKMQWRRRCSSGSEPHVERAFALIFLGCD